MKKILFLTALTVFVLIFGCSNNSTDVPALVNEEQSQLKAGDNSSDPTRNRQSDTPQNRQQQPHDFSDFMGPGAEFKGGKAVNDYSLTMVRRVNHPEFFRLVFEFTGKTGDTEEVPPEYTVTMENEKKLSMRLKGVVKEEVMENKSDILSLSELIQDVTYTREANGEAVITLLFNRPVVFQVFDLAEPARVVLVLRPDMGQMNSI